MECRERLPRPKKWTQSVVFAMTFFRGEHIDYLIAFRQDYRRIAKRYGVKKADRYARRQAACWLIKGCGAAVLWAVLIGKRAILS